MKESNQFYEFQSSLSDLRGWRAKLSKTKMPRLADDLLLEVVGFCISYLYEKCSNERGLFRSAVALTDVRLLQSQIAQGSASLRNDYDPHLVAETLQTSFKELEFPLFHEVYEDFVTTGNGFSLDLIIFVL